MNERRDRAERLVLELHDAEKVYLDSERPNLDRWEREVKRIRKLVGQLELVTENSAETRES